MQATQRWGVVAVLLGALLAGAGNAVRGQETDPVPPVVKPPESVVERVFYVPFKNLMATLDRVDGSVFVPYADYMKLLESAMQGQRKPDEPPVSGVISSAAYTATVQKDLVLVTAVLQVQALSEGWSEVPLKFGEAAIGQLTAEPANVLLRGTGNGTYSLMLPKPGEYQVKIELTARVRNAPEGKSLEMDVPPVGITTLELLIPEADQTIELKPRLVTEPVAAAAQQTRIKASLGSTEKVSARWHPRVGSKPDMELLASVTNQTLITVEDGLVHTDAWLTYEVLRGQLDKVQIAVPKGQRILDITSNAKVKEWKAVDEDSRQLVSVELLSRLDGKVTLEVHTERAAPDEAFDAAGMEGMSALGIHALNVIRESGTIAVKQGSDLTLTVEEQSGLQRIDESEVDAAIKRAGALYFKYYSPAFRLKLQTRPVEPRMTVEHASQIVFREDQVRLRAVANYSIDRAGVFELRFAVPADLVIENVVCDRMKQFDVSDDKSTLTVSLREKTLGAVSVTVFAARPLDLAADAGDQQLPLLHPQGVELENGKVQVYAPEAIDVITDAEKLVGAQPDPSPQAESIANARLVSSWLFNRRPVEIPVRTVRKPTRLTAAVATRAEVQQGQVQVTTDLVFEVEYAGIDTFRFAVPEALADKLQITSLGTGSAPPIKQKSRAAQAVEGWVTWTVVMQREVLGSQPFQITYDLVPTADANSRSETTVVEAVRVLDPYDKADGPSGKRDITVSRTIGEMTVLKDRALSVSAAASGGDAEPIDVRELTRMTHDGFAAFRYFKQPVRLELVANKYDIQGVVETVVSKALVEIVIDKMSVATYRARYQIKSSERQRLRVDLPASVEPLGVLVDRKPVALEKADLKTRDGWNSYFVNVARTKSSDEPFSLVILFRNTLDPKAFQSITGKLLLRLPMIGGEKTDGVAIQQLRAAIWIPDEYALIGTPKSFSPRSRVRLRDAMLRTRGEATQGTGDLDAWIGADAGGVFDFPIDGHRFEYTNLGGRSTIEGLRSWHLPWYTWIVSGALIAIAFLLRTTSWENKLTLLIVGAFALSAYALSDADAVIHVLAVSIYGLVAMVGIWLVHAIVGRRPVARPGAAPAVPTPPAPPADPTPPVVQPQ